MAANTQPKRATRRARRTARRTAVRPAPRRRSDVLSAADARRWRAATGRMPDARTGLFGPASVTWKVNREAVLLLGGGRALLLQVAHPLVAAAVAAHSDF